jgi:hypothetical protein
LLGGSLLIGADAHAAATNTFHIANWSGGAYSKDRSKQFDRCSASTVNAAGITISYSINRHHQWSVTFSEPAWNFTEGLSLNLVLRMGERDDLRGRAVAVGQRTLEVHVDDVISLLARLRLGGQLRVTAGGLAFEFQLADSDEVLSALSQCVLRHTAVPQNPKNSKAPVPARPPQPQLTAATDAAADEEAKALAAAVIAYARIADARMLTPTYAPAGLRAAAAWRSGLITGTVAVLHASEALKVEDLPTRLVEGDARTCRGAFFFVSDLDAIDHLPVARALTSCKTSDAVTLIYYLAVTRANGGFYLLTAMSTGGGFGGLIQRRTEEVDALIRAVITSALRQ